MKAKIGAALRAGIGFFLLYYVFHRTRNWGAAQQFVSAAWLLPVLGAQTLCGTAIEAMRLRVLFRSQRIDVGFGYGYRLCSVAAFFSLCIPGGTGGDVMKMYYLNARARGKAVEVATVVLLDRIVALFPLLCLVVALAVLEGTQLREHAAVRVLVLGALALLVALPSFALLACSATVRSSGLFRRFRPVTRVGDAIYAFRHHKAALARAAGLSFCGHLLLAGMFAAAGTVVLPQVPTPTVCMLALVGMFANAVPVTPGGLGVGESAFQALFSIAGFSGGAVLMLAWRIGMLFPCLVGCTVYMRGLRPAEPASAAASAAGAGD